MVQWLRLQAPKEGRLGSIPGQGIRSHIPQPRILNAVTEVWHSQINIYIKIEDAFSGYSYILLA